MMLVFAALYVALVRWTGRRHNWARWSLLAFPVSGWIMQLPDVPATIAKTPLAAGIDVTCFLIELYSVYLVFLSPGAGWYRSARR